MTRDVFRPSRDPARAIYDAFQEEARKRDDRSVDEWLGAERQVVHKVACDYARKHNLRIPSLEEVIQAETSACGHIDYGAKWAYGVQDVMNLPVEKQV